MSIKLFDSEMKVMDVLWREGDSPASHVADELRRRIGWNKNTTYTVIKKCVAKKAVQRLEPNFICHALVSREEVQNVETDELINKMFDGSAELLFASLLSRKKLPSDVLRRLKKMADAEELGENEHQ